MMYVTMVAQEEQPGQGRQHQRKKGRLEMRSKGNVLSFVLIILIAGMTALFAGCGASGNADAEAGADASGEAVTIVGTDGTVYAQGTSAYTITVETYEESADLSGASAVTPWSEFEAERPEQLS